jgi:integrase
MPRPSRPWFRSDRDAWYAWIGGRRVPLARGRDNREGAYRAFYRLKADEPTPPGPAAQVQAREVANLYYEHAQLNLAPLTAEFYRRHLTSFAAFIGLKAAAETRPKDVIAWVESHPEWNQTTRAGAITAVKRAFRWAARQGHIPADPVVAAEKPQARRRQSILDGPAIARIFAAVSDRPFLDLLTALRDTGARPSEVMKVRAEHARPDRRTWVLESKTTARTGEARKVLLTPAVVAITRRLMAAHPDGPLFRNQDDAPWTRNAMACRFARLRARLGLGREATAESFRHRFATDLLLAGVSPAIVAKLMGHTSTVMLGRNYSHLGDHDEELIGILDGIRGDVSTGS